MADVGRELSWQQWVKLKSCLQAEENVYKPRFCKLLGKCRKYPGNGALVGKNLPHLGNKAENILVLACCALFVLTCSQKGQDPKLRKMDVLRNTMKDTKVFRN